MIYRIIKSIFIFTFIIQIFSFSFAQDYFQYWYQENEIENWFIKNFSLCVVFVINSSAHGIGTGTLLNIDDKPYILTNNHLIKNKEDEINVLLNTKNNKIQQFKCKLIDIDKDHDLVLLSLVVEDKKIENLKITGFYNEESKKYVIPETNAGLSFKNFADKELIRRGYKVLFLGYPMQLGIEKHKEYLGKKQDLNGNIKEIYNQYLVKNPIVRTGIIASEDFRGLFLIDAMVSHGNSGSPVFIRNGYYDKSTNLIEREYLFCGIIRSMRTDNINFYSDNRLQVISIPHNTGLAEVISAEVICNFIEKNTNKK